MRKPRLDFDENPGLQPKVSKILRGQLREFSVERLLFFLRTMGCNVEIVLRHGTGTHGAFRVVEERLA